MKFENGIVTALSPEEAQAICDIYEHKRIGRQNYMQAVRYLNLAQTLSLKAQAEIDFPIDLGDTVYYIDELAEEVFSGLLTSYCGIITADNAIVQAVMVKGVPMSKKWGQTAFATYNEAQKALADFKKVWRENEQIDKKQRKS